MKLWKSCATFSSLFILWGCPTEQQPPSTPTTTVVTEKAEVPARTKEAPKADAPDTMRGVEASALQWKTIPEANGAQMSPVGKTPGTEGVAFFIKFPAGWKHPNHFHTTDFHRVVVDGDLEVTMKDGTKFASKKGDYFRAPANAIHSTSTKNGATIFIVSDGKFSTVTLGEDGKPTKATDPAQGPVTGKPMAVAADKLEWKELMKGVKVAPVFKHPTTQAVGVFLQFGADFKAGRHKHKSSFHRVTLDGELTVTPEGGQAMSGTAGGYFRGIKNLIHESSSKAGGTIFLVSDGEWDTVFVDAEGNALPSPKAP